MSRPAKAEEVLTTDNKDLLAKFDAALAPNKLIQVDTTLVYALCAISACNAPANVNCCLDTPIIAGEIHRLYYCADCFEAYIRPWARNPANNDKVFNRID